MKKGIKKRSGVYSYLDAKGVLDKGEFAIARAKKEYWSNYKKEWRKRKLKVSKCFEVLLSENELSVIETCAKRHKKSITGYLKQAALCYSNQKYLVPDVLTINSIKERLIMLYASVQNLSEERKIGYADCKEITGLIKKIEETTSFLLTTPKLLEEKIKEEVKRNLGYKEELIDLLQKL